MGAVVTSPRERSGGSERARRPLPRRLTRPLFDPGRATLEDRVVALWGHLVDDGTAECPVCGAELGAGRECDGCGSELS